MSKRNQLRKRRRYRVLRAYQGALRYVVKTAKDKLQELPMMRTMQGHTQTIPYLEETTPMPREIRSL
jgi:hypothetical protein